MHRDGLRRHGRGLPHERAGRHGHRGPDVRRGRSRRRRGTWASSPGWGGACRSHRGSAQHRHARPEDAGDAAGPERPRREPRVHGRQPEEPRGDVPCPGWARTGCCPDAAGRHGPRDEVPESWAREPWAREPAAPGPWVPESRGRPVPVRPQGPRPPVRQRVPRRPGSRRPGQQVQPGQRVLPARAPERPWDRAWGRVGARSWSGRGKGCQRRALRRRAPQRQGPTVRPPSAWRRTPS